ncbi:MAG: DUF4407 domain-containing protein [Paludibacteraceae bacterium]|nr:DUF4407 domain-containing protein [Paludibacteraceae bacterium]
MENKQDINNSASKSNIKRSNIFNEFFWICSGANRHILRQCPTEYSKYFGIGGTIFFTAAMAMLSGGYAFYTIFDSINLAIIFGVFWGLLIFNLDRFIVNTMYSDGKHTISWGEFVAGLPRLVIALFLGVVISTPLEMKIFEDRIESQIIKDNARRTTDTRNVANQDYEKLQTLQATLADLNIERKELEMKLNEASNDLKEEGEGSALSGIAGHGPIYKEKEAYERKCQEALDRWERQHRTQIDQLNEDIEILRKKINSFENDIERGVEEDGFCVRYEAFSNIKKEVPAVRIVSLFIMILFIIIEVAPTLFKMMIASGPYDELLKEEMERKKAQSITNVSLINDNANTQIQISVAKNKEKLEAEVLANKIVLTKIAEAQAELIETAIEEWRKEELEKIKANPSQYIKSNKN